MVITSLLTQEKPLPTQLLLEPIERTVVVDSQVFTLMTLDLVVKVESRLSQNIQFEVFTPNVQTLTPKGTSINSRIRTVSARSVSGIETSFVDQGYSPIRLNDSNYFTSPRMVASKVNEDSKLTALPGSKSLNMQCDFSTNDTNVSPVIDIDRVSAILTTNRIDDDVTNFATDGRVKIAGQDPNSATYVTKNVGLAVPATGLKVMFSASRTFNC